MQNLQELQARRREILKEIASLRQMRRGTVTEQYVEAALKDGSKVRRGPYPVYTFKEKGKTVSKRLKSAEEVQAYRRQIQAYRRFHELTADLVNVSEQLADSGLKEADDQKKTPRRSSSGI